MSLGLKSVCWRGRGTLGRRAQHVQRPGSEETAARGAGAQGQRRTAKGGPSVPNYSTRNGPFFPEMMESDLRKGPSRGRGREGCVEQVTQLAKCVRRADRAARMRKPQTRGRRAPSTELAKRGVDLPNTPE